MSAPQRLEISPRAAADLQEIADHIARDDPARAGTFVVELQARCAAIARSPLSYPTRTDLAPGLRMAIYRRYLLLFRAIPDVDIVRIERILHGARNLGRLL